MPQYKIVFQQTVFHTITVDVEETKTKDDAVAKAEYYINKFPGMSKTNKRGLVKWNVEEIK